MGNFLKFRYFLVIIWIFSCKDSPIKKTTDSPLEIPGANEAKTAENGPKSILFFGNSLTAGNGLDTEESFPALIQARIDSLGLGYEVINAGLSGETTAGGKNRLSWVLRQNVAIFVLELGANDGLRGVPIQETYSNLQAIIDSVRTKNSETQIILAGMMIPPNMGQEYTNEFKKIYPELAKINQVHLIPFLLEGVAGDPNLNLPDGIHPTAEGQKIVRENVWAILKDLL